VQERHVDGFCHVRIKARLAALDMGIHVRTARDGYQRKRVLERGCCRSSGASCQPFMSGMLTSRISGPASSPRGLERGLRARRGFDAMADLLQQHRERTHQSASSSPTRFEAMPCLAAPILPLGSWLDGTIIRRFRRSFNTQAEGKFLLRGVVEITNEVDGLAAGSIGLARLSFSIRLLTVRLQSQ